MDAIQQQDTATTQQDQNTTKAKKTSMVTPGHKGPRRLAFRIWGREFTYEGRPSLLISDHNGVWSVTHRRYIRKTRHHRLYWDDMPEAERERVLRLYRDLRRQLHRRRFTRVATPLLCVVVVNYVLMRLVRWGWCGGMAVVLFLDASNLVMAYLLATLLDVTRRARAVNPGT